MKVSQLTFQPSLVTSTAFTTQFNNPSSTIVGLIVAIYEVGCFLGSVATSLFGEQIGRKKSIGTGVVIMIIGALLQATAYTRAHMVVARIVSGTGMGFINSTGWSHSPNILIGLENANEVVKKYRYSNQNSAQKLPEVFVCSPFFFFSPSLLMSVNHPN